MYQTVSLYDFQNAFGIRKDNFTYKGLEALYNYLEDYEENTGEKIELDVIVLCGEYTEYENLEEFRANYNGEYKTIEDVENATTVIKIDDDRFIVQNF